MNDKSKVSTFVTLLLIIGVAFVLLQRSRKSIKPGATPQSVLRIESNQPVVRAPESPVPDSSASAPVVVTETAMPAPSVSPSITQEDPRIAEHSKGCSRGDLDSCDELGGLTRDSDPAAAISALRKVCTRRQFECDSCRELGALLGGAEIRKAREECLAGTARSCMIAASGLAKAGRKSDAFELLAGACGKGDPSNCLYLGEQLDSSGDKEAHARACANGTGTSCLVVAAASSREKNMIQTVEAMKQGCASGSAAACLLYAEGIADKEVLSGFEKSCQNGDLQSCVVLNGVQQELSTIYTRCESGDDLACMQTAYALSQDKPQDSERIAKRLCSKGMSLACEALRGGPDGAH